MAKYKIPRRLWFALLGLADLYGFRPENRLWMEMTRSEAMRETAERHYWWSSNAAYRIKYFTASESGDLAQALTKVLDSGRSQWRTILEPLNDYIHVQLLKQLEQVSEKDIACVQRLAMQGAFRWQSTFESRDIFFAPMSSEDEYPKPYWHSEVLDFSVPPALDISFSELSELERHGESPSERRPLAVPSVETDYRTWRSLLILSHYCGFLPSNPDWKTWVRYYAYCDPGSSHQWFNCGYLKINSFSEEETLSLGLSVGGMISDGMSEVRRHIRALQVTPGYDQESLAVELVDLPILRRLGALCRTGMLSWELYADGVIRIATIREE